jgi:hypothetical protein
MRERNDTHDFEDESLKRQTYTISVSCKKPELSYEQTPCLL